MKEFIEKLIGRLEESVSFTKMERMESRVGKKQTIGFGFGVRSSVGIVKQLAEEYKHCTLCYLQSPCEYQNENAMLQNELLADKSGWIPCSERLPEENQIIMCSVKKEYASHRIVIQRFGDQEYWHNGIIEAWQPLPEPYKERDKKG